MVASGISREDVAYYVGHNVTAPHPSPASPLDYIEFAEQGPGYLELGGYLKSEPWYVWRIAAAQIKVGRDMVAPLKVGNREYRFTVGSDVTRDGMFLEATPTNGSAADAVAEIFYSDKTGQLSISCFGDALPVELIEYLIKEGRKSLPPSSGSRGV